MFKYECFKIFSRKSIYIVFLCIVFIMFYGTLIVPGDIVMKNPVYDELFEEWGGPVTEEKLQLARKQMALSDAGEKTSKTLKDFAEGEIHYVVSVAGSQLEQLKERKEVLQSQLQQLEKHSYDYKLAKKELTMLTDLGDETFGFYLIRAWRGMFSFIEPVMTVIFLSALILLGLTPVFADEYTNKTLGLVLATKHGKRKLVSAKILAAITYILVIFLSLHVINFIFQSIKYGGLHGWNAPMQNLSGMLIDSIYDQSPYSWEVWEFFGVTLTIQFLASLAFGVLVLFLSFICKNSMVAFFLAIAVLGLPTFLGQFQSEKNLLQYIAKFNYVEFMKGVDLFKHMEAFNVFGQPILYPSLILFIFVFVTSIILIALYKLHDNIQVDY